MFFLNYQLKLVNCKYLLTKLGCSNFRKQFLKSSIGVFFSNRFKIFEFPFPWSSYKESICSHFPKFCEERMWEVQRIKTALKRKQKQLRKDKENQDRKEQEEMEQLLNEEKRAIIEQEELLRLFHYIFIKTVTWLVIWKRFLSRHETKHFSLFIRMQQELKLRLDQEKAKVDELRSKLPSVEVRNKSEILSNLLKLICLES